MTHGINIINKKSQYVNELQCFYIFPFLVFKEQFPTDKLLSHYFHIHAAIGLQMYWSIGNFKGLLVSFPSSVCKHVSDKIRFTKI